MQKPKWFSISFFKDWALWTLSLASGGFTVIIALYFFFQGKEPPKSGLLTVLGVCSLFAAWGAGLRERRLRSQAQNTLETRIADLENQLSLAKPKAVLEFRVGQPSDYYNLPSSPMLVAVNVKGEDATRIRVECDRLPEVNTIGRLVNGEWEPFISKGAYITGRTLFTDLSLIELDWPIRIPLTLRWKDTDWNDYSSEWDITYDPTKKVIDVELRKAKATFGQ
jgi:hypothetical protein